MKTFARTIGLSGCVLLAAISCGPVATEPMPDIPERVEYDTVKIEYGEDDLIRATSELVPGAAGALVGDPSGLAELARSTVRGTNRTIFQQIALVEAIASFPPTSFEDDVWTWIDRRDDRHTVFTIERVSEGRLSYLLESGVTADTIAPVFSGSFDRSSRLAGRQQGSGILRFNLEQFSAIDEDADSEGDVLIAFRSFNRIRQVRVALIDVLEQGADNRVNALYEYTQLRNGAGRFKFSSLSDFRNDGEPLERVTVDTAWTPDASGRAAARVTGGSLQINELLLDECWDASGAIVWADAQPDLPTYDDGEFESCAEPLQRLNLMAPVYQPPSGEPEIPNPHPDE